MNKRSDPPSTLPVIFNPRRNRAGRTRRQAKHDLLLTFMSQLRQPESQPKPTKPSAFVKSLLWVFF